VRGDALHVVDVEGVELAERLSRRIVAIEVAGIAVMVTGLAPSSMVVGLSAKAGA